MAVLQVAVFLVSCLLLMTGSGHSQDLVSQADEDRAIDRIQQLIQDLETETPPPPPPPGQRPRVINVCKYY